MCGETERERIRKLAEELDAHRKRVQAQHGLTLTGLYNVLEKLRSFESYRPVPPHPNPLPPGEGTAALRPGKSSTPGSAPARDTILPLPGGEGLVPRPREWERVAKGRVRAEGEGLTVVGEGERANQFSLTAKEKLSHEHGLVSVLKQLHDDLDAAVFAAYGWPATLTDAEILEHLVALNAERAAEEQRGVIHWLRPEYQLGKQKAESGKQNELSLPEGKTKPQARKSAIVDRKSKMEWPKILAARVQAVEAALHRAGKPVAAAELAQQFKRARPENVAEILETLVTLGRAHRKGNQFTR